MEGLRHLQQWKEGHWASGRQPGNKWFNKLLHVKHLEFYLTQGACSVAQSCLTLCNLMDCSPPGSSACGVSQARILEWVAILFSRGIFLTQGWDPCLLSLLHWQVDSLPLSHLGIPYLTHSICYYCEWSTNWVTRSLEISKSLTPTADHEGDGETGVQRRKECARVSWGLGGDSNPGLCLLGEPLHKARLSPSQGEKRALVGSLLTV